MDIYLPSVIYVAKNAKGCFFKHLKGENLPFLCVLFPNKFNNFWFCNTGKKKTKTSEDISLGSHK